MFFFKMRLIMIIIIVLENHENDLVIKILQVNRSKKVLKLIMKIYLQGQLVNCSDYISVSKFIFTLISNETIENHSKCESLM